MKTILLLGLWMEIPYFPNIFWFKFQFTRRLPWIQPVLQTRLKCQRAKNTSSLVLFLTFVKEQVDFCSVHKFFAVFVNAMELSSCQSGMLATYVWEILRDLWFLSKGRCVWQFACTHIQALKCKVERSHRHLLVQNYCKCELHYSHLVLHLGDVSCIHFVYNHWQFFFFLWGSSLQPDSASFLSI